MSKTKRNTVKTGGIKTSQPAARQAAEANPKPQAVPREETAVQNSPVKTESGAPEKAPANRRGQSGGKTAAKMQSQAKQAARVEPEPPAEQAAQKATEQPATHPPKKSAQSVAETPTPTVEAKAEEVSVLPAEEAPAKEAAPGADGANGLAGELKEEEKTPQNGVLEKTSSEEINRGAVKRHIISQNPVFVKAIAIVPILGAAISLKSGILLSLAMLLTVVLLNLVMYPLNRIVPRRFRAVTAFFAAGVIAAPLCFLANLFAPNIVTLCGIYLPLLSVCALPMIEKKHYGTKYGVAKTVLAAALDGLGFAFAALVFSIIREIAGNGTLYDRPLPGISPMKFSFALLPAGGFLLLAFLIALFKKLNENGEGIK